MKNVFLFWAFFISVAISFLHFWFICNDQIFELEAVLCGLQIYME